MRLDPTSGNAKTFLIVGVLIILGLGIYSGVKSLDILPGFEGMQGGAYGETPQGTGTGAIPLGDRFPQSPYGASYSWLGTPTPGTASIDAATTPLVTCLGISCNNDLVIDSQTNPVTATSPFSTPEKVNYYVPVPGSSTTSQLVTGQVEIYSYTLDVSIQSGSAGTWDFGGDTIWYNLLAVDWNQASTGPGGVSGQVYEVPLYGVVTNVVWHDQGQSGCDACVIGHPLTFYSTPNAAGQTLATLAGNQYSPSTTNVNSTLAGIFSPDTRFPSNGLVYYPISLINFRANPAVGGDCAFGCQYPTVQLTIQLYTLRIGQYIVTNPSNTGLGGRSQGCTGASCVSEAFDNLGAWIAANPLLAGLIASLGVGIVVILILAIFATPVIVALVYVLGRRKQT